MIELKNLTKKYGDFTAVDDLNLTIETGEFFGLLVGETSFGNRSAGSTNATSRVGGIIGETGCSRVSLDCFFEHWPDVAWVDMCVIRGMHMADDACGIVVEVEVVGAAYVVGVAVIDVPIHTGSEGNASLL